MFYPTFEFGKRNVGFPSPRAYVQRPFVIFHEPSGTYLPEVDPVTRQSTGRPKQFVYTSGTEIKTIRAVENVEAPDVVTAQEWRY